MKKENRTGTLHKRDRRGNLRTILLRRINSISIRNSKVWSKKTENNRRVERLILTLEQNVKKKKNSGHKYFGNSNVHRA